MKDTARAFASVALTITFLIAFLFVFVQVGQFLCEGLINDLCNAIFYNNTHYTEGVGK